jgi:hypothetical protein
VIVVEDLGGNIAEIAREGQARVAKLWRYG